MSKKSRSIAAAFIAAVAVSGLYATATSIIHGIDKQHAETGNPHLKGGEAFGGLFPFAEYTPPGN